MRKVNRILVPIDFSEESVRALKYAVSLAEETRSELVALHVIEKTDDSDTFMSSVAPLEGSPFPVSAHSSTAFAYTNVANSGIEVFFTSENVTADKTDMNNPIITGDYSATPGWESRTSSISAG